MGVDPVLLMRFEFAVLAFDIPLRRVDELQRRLRRKRAAVDEIARRRFVQHFAVGVEIAVVFAAQLPVKPQVLFGEQLFQAGAEIVAAPARESPQMIPERLQPPVPEPEILAPVAWVVRQIGVDPHERLHLVRIMLRPELHFVAAEGVRAEDERSFDVQRGKGFAVLLHGVHVIAALFDDVALSVAELLRDHYPEFVLQKRIKRLELEDRACAAQSRQENDRMISMTCHKNAHPVSVDLDELPERRLDKLSVPRPNDAVDRVRDEPAERDQRGAQGKPRDLQYFQIILH